MAETEILGKAELMERIAARWAELKALFDALSAEEFEKPLADGWSAKQHMAHISVWEASLLALLRGESRAAAIGVPIELWERHDTDGINASVAERAGRWPFENVRRRAVEIHGEVVTQLEGISGSDLALPYSHYQPNDGEYNADPVQRWVNGDTWEHYEEHIGWLRDGLAG